MLFTLYHCPESCCCYSDTHSACRCVHWTWILIWPSVRYSVASLNIFKPWQKLGHITYQISLVFIPLPVINWAVFLSDHLHFVYSPWSRICEKLTGPHLIKKFLAFYGTWRFITTVTRACHLSLSWARSIQFMPPSYFFKINFIIMLPFILGLQSGPFPHVSLPKPHMHRSSPPYVLMPCPSHTPWFDHPVIFGGEYRS